MLKNKKAIIPSIAIVFLLVITVVLVSFFNSWYKNYSSEYLVDVEKGNNPNSIIFVESLTPNTVYIEALSNHSLEYLALYDLQDNIYCEFQNTSTEIIQNLTENINSFSIVNGSCSISSGQKVRVYGYTEKYTFDEITVVN